MAERKRETIYQEVTNRIIADLEQGWVPWVQPWGTPDAKAGPGLPTNASTANSYSGINILILWGAVIERAFPTQNWLTFRQAKALGGSVRKGEHGATVCYADRFIPKAELERARETGDEPGAVPFLKRYTVFNVAQCDGLPERLHAGAAPLPERETVPHAETLIAARPWRCSKVSCCLSMVVSGAAPHSAKRGDRCPGGHTGRDATALSLVRRGLIARSHASHSPAGCVDTSPWPGMSGCGVLAGSWGAEGIEAGAAGGLAARQGRMTEKSRPGSGNGSASGHRRETALSRLPAASAPPRPASYPRGISQGFRPVGNTASAGVDGNARVAGRFDGSFLSVVD